MDPHAVLHHLIFRVVVSEPHEAQEISVFFLDKRAVKHLLNICDYGNRFLPEPKKNTQEAIVEVGSLKQDLIKGDFLKSKHSNQTPPGFSLASVGDKPQKWAGTNIPFPSLMVVLVWHGGCPGSLA